MINLLPPAEKLKRKQERNLKLVWILGILIVASVLSFALILLAIKFYIADQVTTQQALVEMAREKNVQVKVLQNKIKSVNQTLFELNKFYQSQLSMVGLLERISTLLLPGMYLENFYYQGQDSRVVLSCYASSIDEIHQFRERMRAQKEFEDVNFTLPDWLKAKDINFKVSFLIFREIPGL